MHGMHANRRLCIPRMHHSNTYIRSSHPWRAGVLRAGRHHGAGEFRPGAGAGGASGPRSNRGQRQARQQSVPARPCAPRIYACRWPCHFADARIDALAKLKVLSLTSCSKVSSSSRRLMVRGLADACLCLSAVSDLGMGREPERHRGHLEAAQPGASLSTDMNVSP